MGPFTDDLLQNKVVLITGGATGLGRAMGEKFARLGAKLVICGRREEVLQQAAEELKQQGAKFGTKARRSRPCADIGSC